MTTIIMILIASMSFMFLFLNHPLSFGLILLIETALISMITGMMNYNFWFSYILFLIMVGGMLILFIYMTSVASNEKFKLSYSMSILFLVMVIISMSTMFIDQILINMETFNYDLTPLYMNNSLSMSKFINFPTNKIMVLVISYLLIALIMVVKITNIQYGPLRQKF
nr:NADH dehydrogenase subunit 6 [Ceresium sinicum ornaticolle]